MNPRELTSFFGALSPPWHVGAFPSPAKDFKRQSTRIHLLQSGSGAEREDSKLAWGQQVAPLAPRRQLRTPPCLPAKRPSAGWWWQSHLSRTGVVWIAEVMNALRKHKRMMRDIHPCTFLCLRPPAHHTPHVHTHTHTHCVLLGAWLRLSVSARTTCRHTPHTHTHTPTHPPTPTRRAHTHPPSPHSP